MRPARIADTGPIVAFLSESDRDHAWAVAQFEQGPLPFLTCDAVLTEATYLLARDGRPRGYILDLVRAGALVSAFDVNAEAEALAALLARYRNVPMHFADACLVRMVEQHAGTSLLTLDSDFLIYRHHGHEAIPVVMP